MQIKFDKFNRIRQPNVILCNPSEEEICCIADAYDRNIVLRYNAMSEFSFYINEKYGNGEDVSYYSLVKASKLIKVSGLGVFVITSVSEEDTGVFKRKNVTCKSLEYELSQKGISLAEGTYKFYDAIPVGDTEATIMEHILSYLPDWKIGEIDSDLWNLYRTFEITEKNLYDFMVNDVEEAYECVFVFNSLNKTISAYSPKNAVHNTSIFLSNKNVVKSLDIQEEADELKTALSVYGADDVNIRSVNPLGGAIIYDFSYYKTEEWMSADLIDAITAWEDKCAVKKKEYSTYLARIKSLNAELLLLNVELTALEGELSSLNNIKSVRAEQGLDLTQINNDIANKEIEIERKKQAINTKRAEIGSAQLAQSEIVESLSFETNFTEVQYNALMRFIKLGSYKNEAFVITDSMEDSERQEILERLYDVGVEVLGRVSQPKYSFNIDAINFLVLTEYEAFSRELELGSVITLEIEKGKYAYPVLLEMEINYDDSANISLSFGNRLRLDKSEYSLAELFKDAVDVAGDVNFNKGKWGESVKVKNQFNEYLNSSLNTSLQEIINNDNMDIIIDNTGIHCRRFNEELSGHDPEQLWITGKSMLFSDDGFNTAKMAIGRLKLPDNTYGYGVNAEVLMGKLMATSQLLVENEAGTFRVDGSGATLIDADFTLTTKDGLSKILLSSTDGIKIQGKKNNAFEDKLYIDMNGNLNLKGHLVGATGEFSGKLTASDLIGGTIDIGSGRFTVDVLGNATASSLRLTGGSINVKDNFTVDEQGNVIANNITIKGGNLNLNNLTMTGTISWGALPSDVAGMDDVPILPDYITATKITDTMIESCSITGGMLHQRSLFQASGNISIQEGGIHFLSKDDSKSYGRIYASTSFESVVIEGKLTDENGNEITGTAVFG